MSQTRRDFVKSTSLITGSLIAAPFLSEASMFNSLVDDTIKVALIGCGGRGTGAAIQALSTKQNVKLVAMADAFQDRLDNCYKEITGDDFENLKSKIDVPADRRFVGFDAYLKAIPLADVVILTTPPGFRPLHFEAAVNAGKHIFMEKPVATDPAGVQRVLAAAEKAKAKKLNVVVGLQRHYQTSYRELMKRLQDGMVGDIVSASAWWNNDGVWVNPRKAGQTEMEYQMRNWYYFNWLCGDHITEQHIHNIDVINWVKNSYPVKARGTGGREVRKGKDYGEIFDHHIVEFEYADGTILNSQCRHIKGTWAKVDELVVGTKGKIMFDAGHITDYKGNTLFKHNGSKDPNPYQVEHDELFEAIAKGQYKFADAENGAKSTMTSILGRMATYSGQVITWDKAINSGLDLAPKTFAWDADMPLKPDANGLYPVAIPGKTKFV
ncbi:MULTISPECIES: Gfo/Idh/MocA family protein [Bacteroidota]|jgi:predicted dehydrogenase|uniref:Gfo/Idh/MocA family oxidoreductase n=2 Tax=Flectobacillus TaxID=101 RepID=A0ABT6Z497_9BACT|nr:MULTISPECIES: Gfo/Idh/MocA family oxidoreductase [Bacteroidota]MDI9864825.1 Gfo/Idh/MocA family oxidoreductase [Flectobacillus longus]MDI9875941.1 Gfo/Idh/MocA family oxidoreductase [Flectobacillus rivi]NBB29528.1 Gfo/Idh/MocA family oxidoreductase [Cellulophaga sp. BC115SP]